MITHSKDFEADVRQGWFAVRRFVKDHHGKRPDLTAVLLLIGLNEVPHASKNPSKEEIVDLIHVGTCTSLGIGGHYVLIQKDNQDWPHFELDKPLPSFESMRAQETYLKYYVIQYFKSKHYISDND